MKGTREMQIALKQVKLVTLFTASAVTLEGK